MTPLLAVVISLVLLVAAMLIDLRGDSSQKPRTYRKVSYAFGAAAFLWLIAAIVLA